MLLVLLLWLGTQMFRAREMKIGYYICLWLSVVLGLVWLLGLINLSFIGLIWGALYWLGRRIWTFIRPKTN